MEAGKKRLAGDIVRQANSSEVTHLRKEASELKEVVAGQTSCLAHSEIGLSCTRYTALNSIRHTTSWATFEGSTLSSRPHLLDRSAPIIWICILSAINSRNHTNKSPSSQQLTSSKAELQNRLQRHSAIIALNPHLRDVSPARFNRRTALSPR